ncbi:MAG: TldD/PmbA family protein [Spirochaetes bacterium]|nr:TldD/PmbA family protein [Spirochaetota bacterium]
MIAPELCQSVLQTALQGGGEFADIFIEEKKSTVISFEDGKIKNISTGTLKGVGLRLLYGKNYIYVYGNDFSQKGLIKLAETLARAVVYDKKGNLGHLTLSQNPQIISPKILPSSIELAKKIDIINRANQAARDYSPMITQVRVSYVDMEQKVFVANSEGKMAEDNRLRTRFIVNSVAKKGEIMESGASSPGKSMGFEFFERYTPEDIATEASRVAVVLLDADFAPTGKLPVVIDNGFGGVILHEAVGHALEATSVADNASVFTGKLGEKIANDCVTAIDDGTIPNEWGSYNMDDEGHCPQKNVLIENGILKSFMIDKLGSIKMDLPCTGNGRKQSYEFAPTSRMSNTFIAPGKYKLNDLIGSVDYGIYCKKMGGGSVNPPTTDFNFAVNEAYLIKQGKLDKPLKGAALIGKGSDIIQQIDMVADNLDFGTGMCGSKSGSVPANVGQPAIRVAGLVVGGRNQ